MPQIKIYVNQQLDGCTYRLDPKSRGLLRGRESHTEPVTSVFISYDTKTQFEWTHGSVWRHVAELLTGLTTEQLEALGPVVFVEPKDESTVFEVAVQNV